MPHACKGNAPVNVKEKFAFVQAIKRGHGCVYVCVIIKQIFSTQLPVCVCVCVMEALQ